MPLKTSSKSAIRVLHVVDDFSTLNTGVMATVRQLAQWQAGCFDWVGIHSVGELDMPVPQNIEFFQSPASYLMPNWRYPLGGARRLLEIVRTHRVTHLHIHEFWRGGYAAGMLAARKNNLAVILSAHGSVAPWALRGQGLLKGLKKRLYWELFARFLFKPGSALHAITSLEAVHMEEFFCQKPLAIIPNALSMHPFLMEDEPTVPIRRLVFLGRLHPVKGVDLLIEAFGKALLDDDWELIIAGPEEVSAYTAQLKAQSRNCPRAAHIHFIGPLYGAEKEKLLRSAWAVVAPSRTEVIGLVNLESASLATPTITTPQTGLTEWSKNGGILTDYNVIKIQNAIQICAAWSLHERMRRGRQIRQYVFNHYSLGSVGQKWLRFYQRITISTPTSLL